MENSGTTLSPTSILVIDDEENMRHMLSKMLTRAGYRTQTAADGAQGLAVMATTGFDYILCDVKMPNMDGIGFLEHLKEVESNATIIMMSAYGTIDLAVQAMRLGAYDFISKPFKSDEVLLAIRKAEERRESYTEGTAAPHRRAASLRSPGGKKQKHESGLCAGRQGRQI